jgi:hypothetical protein
MIFIFLIVHLFFAGIFYLIGAPIEAFLFWILGLAICFLFFPFSRTKKSETHSEAVAQSSVQGVGAKTVVLTFFRSYTLPLALSLFYMASLGLLWSLSLTLGLQFTPLYIGFVCINILGVIFLKKSINQLVRAGADTSLLQIGILTFMAVAVLLVQMGEFSYPELLLSLAVVALLYNESIILAEEWKKRLMPILFLGSITFWVISIEILMSLLFTTTLSLQGVFFLALGMAAFELSAYNPVRPLQPIGRVAWLILVYLGTASAIGLHIFYRDIWQLPVLAVATIFNLFVHRKFENYPSLFMAVFAPIAPVLTYVAAPTALLQYIITAGVTAGLVTFLGRVLRTRYSYDEYVYQALAILLLIIFTGEYLYAAGFQGVLQISCILLLFSILFFVSFLQIRNRALYAKNQ